MKISVEISIYPLQENYEKSIKDFIRALRKTDFKIIETPLSTHIYGDYEVVTAWLKEHVYDTFMQEEHCVVTIKMLKGDRSNYRPFQ